MDILGISAYYHDSAAALLRDGHIVAAAQEERFTRRRHDAGFPMNAVRYCLTEAGLRAGGTVDAVSFYDKPVLKFARILETCFAVAPQGLRGFRLAMPLWLRRKLWIPLEIETALAKLGIGIREKLYFPEHHESHAASAFYPSPFQHAAILTLDGVGEWATSTIGVGRQERIELLRELRFPHSLGLLYSAFTYFTGFKVNGGEYKMMGLAPYGKPRYKQRILDNLLDLKADGSFRLNMDYFGYLDALTMTNDRFAGLFGGPPRKPETEITQRELDMARSIQEITEEIVLKMAVYARHLTGCEYACLAGGVTLNCVANGRLLREGPFKDIWIQPAAGDAGGALGAALAVWHACKGRPRDADGRHDTMQGTWLGPAFSAPEIAAYLRSHEYPCRHFPDETERADTIAAAIARGKIVGCFQGRMEFGPRALGNRSILADARVPDMQAAINANIKYRESFRPFAPACLAERAGDYFQLDRPSPYMLLAAPVRNRRATVPDNAADLPLSTRLQQVRSDIPAVTHVDYSARIQTVHRETNPFFYAILKAFEKRTGCAVVVNTSFNVRGEPIVCTPDDAYRCFMRTGMDILMLGPFMLEKDRQPLPPAEWLNGVKPD